MTEMKFLTEKQLNIIRGKACVGAASPKEILSVFSHYDKLEMWLEDLTAENYFNGRMWQQAAGLPDTD